MGEGVIFIVLLALFVLLGDWDGMERRNRDYWRKIRAEEKKPIGFNCHKR